MLERLARLPQERARDVDWPLIQHWMENDFEAATEWVESRPPGELKRWIGAMMYDGHGNPRSGCFDRGRFWDWVYQFAPSEIGSVLWWSDDLQAVGTWLSRHPEVTPDLESARSSFAKKLAAYDSEAAIAWASTLDDEGKRKIAFEEIARRWMEAEPWAAGPWAKKVLGWSDEEIARGIERFKW